MIVVPAAGVLAAVDDCISKSVRAICVISAGFSECDAAGREREAALLERIRQAGCRLIGPNCMGLLNTDPAVQPERDVLAGLSAGRRRRDVHAERRAGPGDPRLREAARHRHLELRVGRQQGGRLGQRPHSILGRRPAHLGHPAVPRELRESEEVQRDRAARGANEADRGGQGGAIDGPGHAPPASHTGALASSDASWMRCSGRPGVIRTERLEEMFDVAVLLSHQPVPRGARVAILTNAGGPGILAADACEANGLELPPLGERDARRAALVSAGGCQRRQPGRHAGVGAARSTTGGRSRRSCATTQVDSVIAIFIPPLVTDPGAVAAAIAESAREARASRCSGCSCGRKGHRPRWRRFPPTPFPSLPRSRSRVSPPTASGASEAGRGAALRSTGSTRQRDPAGRRRRSSSAAADGRRRRSRSRC